MKQGFSKNTLEVFAKTIFHYVPEILTYIDEIKELRKIHDNSKRYLIMSEVLKILECEKILKKRNRKNSL